MHLCDDLRRMHHLHRHALTMRACVQILDHFVFLPPSTECFPVKGFNREPELSATLGFVFLPPPLLFFQPPVLLENHSPV